MPTILLALVLVSNVQALYVDLTAEKPAAVLVENSTRHNHVPEAEADPPMDKLWEEMFVLREWDGSASIHELSMARTVEHVLKALPVPKKDGFTHTLIMETAQTESHMGRFNHASRCPGGYGIFQIHTASANYVLKKTTEPMRSAVMAFYDSSRTMEQNLENNVRFSVAMCALYYHEHGLEKRNLTTMRKRGEFWKDKYNTVKGAGTVSAYIKRNGGSV